MKIIIPGGSGQTGTFLARALTGADHEVVVLSRAPTAAPWRMVPWDAQTLGPWTREIEGADVLINLVGRSVNCRYTPGNRQQIMQSRVDSIRVLAEAMAQTRRPPAVWLQAGTATIYAHRYDAANDEATGILGGSEPNLPDTWAFSVGVAKAWEQAFEKAHMPGTRKVILRSALTLSVDRGGVFDTLLGLVRRGVGGASGDGRQFVSWIHETDFARAVDWLITHDELSGPINLAAPEPLPNRNFMALLRSAWGARIGLPANNAMLEIAARLMGTETELILKSRRVIPTRLAASGFEFLFPHWGPAAVELCGRWRIGLHGLPYSSTA